MTNLDTTDKKTIQFRILIVEFIAAYIQGTYLAHMCMLKEEKSRKQELSIYYDKNTI